MPNGRIHRAVGGPAGGVYAGIRAWQSPLGDPLIEALAGIPGGILGAAAPDGLEPAGWNHRRIAHSLAAGGLLVGLSETVQSWAEWCRVQAEESRARANDESLTELERFGHSLVAILWQLIAGFLTGFLAGYVSHLALDAQTPAGIPII